MSAADSRRDGDDRILRLLGELYVAAGGVPTVVEGALLDLAEAEAESQLSLDARIERVSADLQGADLEGRLRPIVATLRSCGPLERDRLVGVIAKRWRLRVPAVRDMIESAPVGDPSGAGGDPRGGARGIIQEVVSDLGLVRDLRHVEFAVMGSEAVPVGSSSFAKRIAYLVRELHGVSVTASMITDAVLPLLGADLPVIEVPVRVAGDTERVILDLADGTGRAIVITADGAKVLETSPVAFLRPAGIAPLPEPAFPDSPADVTLTLDAYWSLLGYVKDEAGRKARAGTFAWLMSALRRATNYVVAFLVAAKGTGKTWRARMMRDAVDPYALDVESIPQDLEQLTVCAMSSHALAFDNVSRVQLDISDGLCSLATGGGRRARKFYTESEAVLFRFARPVILTSIVEAVTEGDLLDRALTIRAPKAKRRKNDEKLAAEFAELHPRLLGALCYLVSVALKRLAAVVVPDDVRMQSAAAFAAAAEEAAGFEAGAVFAAYRQAQEDARSIIAEQPVPRAVLDWVAEPTFGAPEMQWSGTATELRTLLTERVCGLDDKGRLPKREPKGWPGDGRVLSSVLRRITPTLAELGVGVDFGWEGTGVARHRIVVVTRRDAEANAIRDAGADLEIAINSQLGTHGTHGTQDLAASSDSTKDDAVGDGDGDAADALSFSPEERELSVPCVPCVPEHESIGVIPGRTKNDSVPCVPSRSVPPASLSDQPYGIPTAALRARAIGARVERSFWSQPDGEYPRGHQLVVEVETKLGRAVFVRDVNVVFPDQTLALLSQFGGRREADGTYVLHAVDLSVQVCRRVIFGIGDVFEVVAVSLVEPEPARGDHVAPSVALASSPAAAAACAA